MGKDDFNHFYNEKNAMRACADMLIAAAPEHATMVIEADARHSFPGLVSHACANDEAIPPHLIDAAQVLVVEVDPDLPQSISRLIELGRRYPHLPRIAAIANGSVPLVRTLVREGVADVVSLPFRLEELLEASLSAVAAAKARSQAEVKLAPLVTVVGSIGSCGATSLATHLACEIGAQIKSTRDVAVVDFDLQSGTVADYLGCTGIGSLGDLLAAGDRLDAELMLSIAQSGEHKIAVFAAPPEIEPIENVATDQVLRLLDMMRQHFAGVVVDLPTDWTNWALSSVSASDLVVLVVELTVNSLRQAKRRMQLLASVGIEPERIVLVVNRVERRLFKSINLSDVSTTLGGEVVGSLALEEPQLSSAQAQGLLAGAVTRKSKYNADVAKIAADLAARLHFVAE